MFPAASRQHGRLSAALRRPERERRAERRSREAEREERGADERGRKRDRQRERIEWQGGRPGEREEDARGAEKRRREEPREERAYGRQARPWCWRCWRVGPPAGSLNTLAA